MRGYGDNSGALKQYEGEVLLLGYGWNPDKGHWITLALDVADTEGHPFNGFKRGLERGQRFRMTFTPILDNEEPLPEQPAPEKPDKRRFEDMPASQQAGIRCGEVAYQRWLPEAPSMDASVIKPPSRPMPPAAEDARYRLCYRLAITSLRELDTDEYARDEFREMDRQYRIDTGKEPWRP